MTQRTGCGKRQNFVRERCHGCNRPVSTPPGDPSNPAAAPSSYALAPALRARLLGTGLGAVGVVVLLGILVTWLLDLSTVFVSGLVLLAAAGVLTLGLLLGLRHWVVRLDEAGYRVRLLRPPSGGPQARTARWSDVLDLRTTTAGGQRCVELRLRDGRTTTVPVGLVEGDSSALVDDLSAHLDRGHGYRRLR